MNIIVKRFDGDLPMPEYKTPGAVGMDLCSRVDMEIKPGEIGYVPLNVAVKVPSGYFVLLAVRSSTHKMGLMPVNGIGVIDNDYCGDEDELKFAAYNFTKDVVKIEKGMRVAQMIIVKFEKGIVEEVGRMDVASRGGFGTTGKI